MGTSRTIGDRQAADSWRGLSAGENACGHWLAFRARCWWAVGALARQPMWLPRKGGQSGRLQDQTSFADGAGDVVGQCVDRGGMDAVLLVDDDADVEAVAVDAV